MPSKSPYSYLDRGLIPKICKTLTFRHLVARQRGFYRKKAFDAAKSPNDQLSAPRVLHEHEKTSMTYLDGLSADPTSMKPGSPSGEIAPFPRITVAKLAKPRGIDDLHT